MISIVDDDASVREATKRLVRSLGFDARSFPSAEAFLQSSRIDDSACLITDVQMPGMSGVELQDELHTNGHQVPMIFMTAFPEEHVRNRVLNAGAVGFLIKPFGDECLIKCLEKALNGRDSAMAPQ